jgi:hypothetical protein
MLPGSRKLGRVREVVASAKSLRRETARDIQDEISRAAFLFVVCWEVTSRRSSLGGPWKSGSSFAAMPEQGGRFTGN